MACNGMFGAGQNGLINPPQEDRTFQLAQGNGLEKKCCSTDERLKTEIDILVYLIS